MAGFKFTSNGGDGKFHIGRLPSIFTDGVTFTLSKCLTGVFTDETGKVVNHEGSNSIRFTTNLSSSEDDSINLNRLLSYRKVVYDANGRASLLFDFEGHQELRSFLESLGRDESDPSCLKGTAKEVGEAVLKYFEGKTFVVKEVKDVFFKNIQDGKETLQAPYSPVIQFSIKED